MAKALLGGVGRMDPHTAMTVRKLHQRIVDLETEILGLRAENETMRAALTPLDDVVVLTVSADRARAKARKQPAMA